MTAPKAKNLVSGTLAETITTSTTNILVHIGDNVGAQTITNFFPTAPFYITIMPKAPAIGVANNLDSEIMLITAVSNDQVGNAALTATRAQRGTTAKAFSEGDIVTVGSYADDAVFLDDAGSSQTPQPWIGVADIIWSQMIDKIYPVGSIFMSATLTTAADVGAELGGTWTAWGAGRVPVGMGDNGETEYTTVEDTGGSETHKHLLPILTDNEYNWSKFGWNTSLGYGSDAKTAANTNNINNSTTANSFSGRLLKSDFGDSRQPYITCYMYKRTA